MITDTLGSTTDSITYHSADSVTWYQRGQARSCKLVNPSRLLTQLLVGGAYQGLVYANHHAAVEESGLLRMSTKKGRVMVARYGGQSGHTGSGAKYRYRYDKQGRLQAVICKRSEASKSSRLRYQYAPNQLTASDELETSRYYFDAEGYLSKQVCETDTNPLIMVYEYEEGKGNAACFAHDLTQLPLLLPLIY